MPQQFHTNENTEALIFALNGVLCDGDALQRGGWFATFRDVLPRLGHKPDYTGNDYVLHAAGRCREDTIRAVLTARNISVPEGDPSDSPTELTVAGIANLNAQMTVEVRSVVLTNPLPGAIELLQYVRSLGVKVGVVTPSTDAHVTLERLGMTYLIDEVVSTAHIPGAGSPAPGGFLTAMERMGVAPEQTAAVDSSLSGVRAAKAARVGQVIGMDRGALNHEFMSAGACGVIRDIGDLRVHFSLSRTA